MKHKYQIISALLPLFLCLGLLGLSASAEGATPVTTWDDLQTAIKQATGETTIHIQGTLEKDNQDTVITVPKGVHITLVGDKTDDLAATIVRPSQSTVGEFVVPDGASLTLKGDIAIAGSEVGTVPKDLTYAHFIQVAKGGRLQIEGAVTASTEGSYYKSSDVGLIVCEGTATLSDGAALSGWLNPLSSGEFDGESAALVIKGKDASLTMNGGEIFNNNATASNDLASSAAVQIRDGATFTMNGGSIHDNSAGKLGCGGGVMVTGAESTFTMTGGDIRANQGRYGAGIYIEGQATDKNAGTDKIPATFTMSSGTISQNALNNSGGSKGGGLYAENSTVAITKAADTAVAPTFDGNKTSFMGGLDNPFTSDGGAIYCADSTLTMDGAAVTNTKADSTNGHGGTIHLDNTKANLANTTLSKNQCGTDNMAFAGALYITGSSEIYMDHMTITDNTAAPISEYTNGGAGAMLISGDANKSAKVTITNSDISNNMTGGANAGAIYAEGATLSIADTSINDNTVKTPDGQEPKNWFLYNGGALYLVGSTVELNRVTLNDNQAVGGFGGAIMAENIVDRSNNIVAASDVTLTDCTLKNNKAEKVEAITKGGMGGAIYVDSGTLRLKGQTTVENNSAFAGGGILVGEKAVLDVQGQTVIQGNSAAEGGNGDGICVMSKATPDATTTNIGTLTLKDEARIAPDNDVTLFPGAVITIAAPYQGASTAQPIHITSYEEAIENLESSTQGTPLVNFTDAAGGAAKAQEADQGKHFVSSKYMPNPQGPNAGKMLLIGQSKVENNTHILTYLGAAQGVTVTFDANGGAWANGSTTQSQHVIASGNLALPENPAKDDKVFNGWNTKVDGTGTAYAPDASIPAPQTDTTYYAQWKDKDSGDGGGGSVTRYVTLNYDSNGGTHYDKERYTRNTTVQLDKTPTRDGYTFTGWYADQELTQKISEIKMTTNKTVYAGWQTSKVPGMLNGEEHFAYMFGYPNGQVQPKGDITRAETAAVFFRLLKDDVRDAHLTDNSIFTDVPKDQWYTTPICTMNNIGIIKGRTDTTFVPNAPITRAEFAVICARFDTGEQQGVKTFSDIGNHWAKKDIERAASLGWISGDPDGKFRPNDFITRAEAATMINNVLCRLPETKDDLLDDMKIWPDNPENAWYYLAIQEATNSHDYNRKDNGYEKWTALID